MPGQSACSCLCGPKSGPDGACGVALARQLHSLGVVHMDIKPANVMINVSDCQKRRGRVLTAKFVDFGNSKSEHFEQDLRTHQLFAEVRVLSVTSAASCAIASCFRVLFPTHRQSADVSRSCVEQVEFAGGMLPASAPLLSRAADGSVLSRVFHHRKDVPVNHFVDTRFRDRSQECTHVDPMQLDQYALGVVSTLPSRASPRQPARCMLCVV